MERDAEVDVDSGRKRFEGSGYSDDDNLDDIMSEPDYDTMAARDAIFAEAQ